MQTDSEGLLLFGACAVVAVAVVVIEEWPNIKDAYNEVRARRRRRMLITPHETHLHHPTIPIVDEPMAASGIQEPVRQQEMSMRSRNIMVCPIRLKISLMTGWEEWDTST